MRTLWGRRRSPRFGSSLGFPFHLAAVLVIRDVLDVTDARPVIPPLDPAPGVEDLLRPHPAENGLLDDAVRLWLRWFREGGLLGVVRDDVTIDRVLDELGAVTPRLRDLNDRLTRGAFRWLKGEQRSASRQLQELLAAGPMDHWAFMRDFTLRRADRQARILVVPIAGDRVVEVTDGVFVVPTRLLRSRDTFYAGLDAAGRG